ncbi:MULTISPECIES: hypothetical protein [unclassified Pseudomonas]|uniref:hypothetical protein n=1 Tax=unclassified Pseudomonas TaxID=196821 RepID=UPI0011144E70|nr:MULTISPECIES: hypothetical protein [unclassified Pseudomonas]
MVESFFVQVGWTLRSTWAQINGWAVGDKSGETGNTVNSQGTMVAASKVLGEPLGAPQRAVMYLMEMANRMANRTVSRPLLVIQLSSSLLDN